MIKPNEESEMAKKAHQVISDVDKVASSIRSLIIDGIGLAEIFRKKEEDDSNTDLDNSQPDR